MKVTRVMAKMLTKADIIAADDLKKEVVEVPEWGGDVTIRSLSLGQIDDIRALTQQDAFKDKFGYLMLAESMVDENDVPLFAYNEIAALEKKSVQALKRVLDVANRLNALTPAAVESAKNGSAATPSNASPTD